MNGNLEKLLKQCFEVFEQRGDYHLDVWLMQEYGSGGCPIGLKYEVTENGGTYKGYIWRGLSDEIYIENRYYYEGDNRRNL